MPARLVTGVIVPLAITWCGPAATRAVAGQSASAVSGSTYERDFAAFVGEVDRTYPFFDLKGNREDWSALKGRLAKRVERCGSDSEFLRIVVEAIGGLHDSHMRVYETKVKIPAPLARYYPGLSFMPATKGRVVILWADLRYGDLLRPGMVVTKIDGQDARACLEARAKDAWRTSYDSSPQRTRLYEYRIPLRGDRGESHRIEYLSGGVGGKEEDFTLTCDMQARGWPHAYHLPERLVRVGRSFSYTKLPSGSGYMRCRRVDGSVTSGMAQSLAAHADARGWIVDLCGNGGGGYDASLIALLKRLPRPVAVLIDAGCMSAGETLARDLRRYAGARLFGSRTAGASSSKRTWRFPSGIASVMFSTRSRWRADGKAIEFNGIEPDVEVEAVPEDVLSGLNSSLQRAQEYLDGVATNGNAKDK
ncbi:MAG: hypothetical protein JXQ73_00115 [Phycisphaerae bacterium]|nr:hypothetical protein [Phycisphaerae bacterium]